MKEFRYHAEVPKGFTGTCKVHVTNSMNHFKDGKHHSEICPAIQWNIDSEKVRQEWRYEGRTYGKDNDFTVESWKEFVASLKAVVA